MNNAQLAIEQLAEAKNDSTKFQLIKNLGNLGDESSLRILIDYLNTNEDDKIKSYAADAIIQIGGKKATALLLKSLPNKSWITRMKVVEILGELADKRAIYQLIRILRNDTKARVREWAAISLGKMNDKRTIKVLIQTLRKDSDWQVRVEAALALGKIGEKEAKKALMETFYNDREYQVSWASASSLGKLHDNKSKKIISQLTSELTKILIEEKDETILGAAAKTLGEIGNLTEAKLMLQTMKVSKEFVRLELNIALEKMARRFDYDSREELIQDIQ
ncbi:MAG: HEAT repeat domain-containing protein [Candidatus Heimdallarchaeota archaeon]